MREISWKVPALALLTLFVATVSWADLYVANFGGASVTIYPPATAGGNTAPSRTIAGSNTGLNGPEGVFADTVNNELFVADFGGNSIFVFALNASGNVAPIRTLNTGGLQVRDVVVDTVHNELIVDDLDDTIRVFARTASGAPAPLRTISGANTLLDNPISIAFDPGADELFVDSYNVGGSSVPGILVFNRTDSGNVAPKRFIAGSNTQMGTFTNYVTLDLTNGELLAQGDTGQGVVAFNLTDSGNVAPKRNLTGPSTGLADVGGLIVDNPNNRLIATTRPGGTGDSVRFFARTANGDTPPLEALSGPATGLSEPIGLALDAVGGLTGTGGVNLPALSWKALLALALMMALIGSLALQRLR